MARVVAILRAVAKAFRRGNKSITASATSHFFLDCIYFLQQAGAFLFVLGGILLLFPLSGDPLRVIPRDRLLSWPLSVTERRWLRALGPWLNWVTWVMASVTLWVARGFVARAEVVWVGIFATGFLVPAFVTTPAGFAVRALPGGPGITGLLFRKNLRELFMMLDVYLALILVLAASAYRIWGSEPLPEQALWMLTMLVVLVFSSHVSALLALESRGGMTRYRLWPLRGWQILAVKDAALAAVVLLLSLPLDPRVGLAALLAMLAVGHIPSVTRNVPQARWRFSVGAPPLTFGLLQLLVVGLAAAGTHYNGAYVILLCAAAYVGSLFVAGRQFDKASG